MILGAACERIDEGAAVTQDCLAKGIIKPPRKDI